MITAPKLLAMLSLQADMNAKVNPDWLKAGYPFLRAVVVEGAEAMDHYGWKWWKSQTADIAQFRIELVDIWHFALSHTIVNHLGDHEAAADQILKQLNGPNSIRHAGVEFEFLFMNPIEKLELMISMAASTRVFSFPLFESLLGDAGMTWETLHTGYVAKNVLNFFRQDNGYKNGTYIKNWLGEEDNVVLDRVVAAMNTSSATFSEELYADLGRYYSDVLVNQGRLAEAERVRAVNYQPK